jgi:AcrR family transcriptional regulator
MSSMPNRAPTELVWDAPAPSGNRGGGLSREAIVAAAVAVADADGLDAVSIRRVAGDLGVRPMSLYTHIASKDDLLDLMVNEVVAEALVPEPLPEDWRSAVREIAVRSHDAFLAHPWTLQAFSQRPRVGPNTLRHAEQSSAAVAGLGLDPRTAATLLAVADDYALGHAMRAMFTPHEAKLREMLTETLRAADPSDFPHLMAAQDAVPLEDSFEIGLEALLEGLERTLLAR